MVSGPTDLELGLFGISALNRFAVLDLVVGSVSPAGLFGPPPVRPMAQELVRASAVWSWRTRWPLLARHRQGGYQKLV